MRCRLLLLLAVLLTAPAALAQTIAYTVQVVAVSDQAQAFSLIRELGVDGFPAYATRATTEQGDVVRVRVGGFANRAAALLYAEAMPDFPSPGNRPLPALADNVPAGVMPFEPRLLLDTVDSGFSLISWGDGVAAEFLPAADGSRTYQLFQAGNTVTFSAWQAWPEEGGLVLRYRDLPLWPADREGLTAELLEREAAAQLQFLEARLQLEPGGLQTAVRQRTDGPAVVILERFNPFLSLETGQLLAVLIPAADGHAWQGQAEGLETPSPQRSTLVAEPGQLSVTATLSADDWQVEYDPPFMLQSVPGGSRSWRAAVGAPLWTDGTWLLARHEGRLLLYDFVPRP